MLVAVVVFLTEAFYVSRLPFLASGTPPWLFRSAKAFTSSELYPGYFPLLYFCQAFHFKVSATVLSGHVSPTYVFYLALLPHIFWHVL